MGLVMLDTGTRTAVLALHQRGLSKRRIARTLGVSRDAVNSVIASGNENAPEVLRPEKPDAHRDEIIDLYQACKGNLVRVHEELLAQGAELSYSALTAFCRRHHLVKAPKPPAGQYHFKPGQEMQHDTSPHRVTIGGKEVVAQTASLVLAYSRMTFIQLYPRFDRFICKAFLQDALVYFGGACGCCMIDNTSVVVLKGVGRHMTPVPEMKAFADRLGFSFAAHEIGDANRKARVERNFHFAEHNFIPGRTFSDWADLNQQAKRWCDKINRRFIKRLHAKPTELYQAERSALVTLPAWLPEVYRLHQRIVDIEGFVSLHRHRYSVPFDLINRQVQVRETKDAIVVYLSPREICRHPKVISAGRPERIVIAAHRPPRGQGQRRKQVDALEQRIRDRLPESSAYLLALKKKSYGRGVFSLRRLLRMVMDYPKAPLLAAIAAAEHYGLYDLERLERMVLRQIQTDFFDLRDTPDGDPDAP